MATQPPAPTATVPPSTGPPTPALTVTEEPRNPDGGEAAGTLMPPTTMTLSPTATLVATPTPVPPLSGRIDVALDPGHSQSDPGASGGGVAEYELTLPLAHKIRDRLAVHGLAVVLTRTDDQPLTAYRNPDPTTRIRLEQEARIAAGSGARIYVSLHFNGHEDPRVQGSTVYYNPNNHGAQSQRLATLIQHEIVIRIREQLGYHVPDLGVHEDLSAGKSYGHFFALRGSFPSVLVRSMYLTDPQAAALLQQESTLDVLADAYAEGIHQYLMELDGAIQRSR